MADVPGAAVGVLVALVATSWGVLAQQQRRVDDNALKNASKTPNEWLTYGLDYGETRYSTLEQIDTTNVSRLGPPGLLKSDRAAAGRKPLR